MKLIVNKYFMASTWVLRLAFIIYPLIIFNINTFIKQRIPEKEKRRKFKREKEFVIKMVYLIIPLLLFHIELFYLDAGYSFKEIGTISLIVLFLLQVFLLTNALISLHRLFAELRAYDE